MRLRTHALALLGILAAALPAAAEDYPFFGDLTIAGNGEGTDPLDARRCALSFIRQDKAGEFAAYHVDLDKFIATGQVSYLIFQKGSCIHDPKTRIERCSMTFDTDRNMQGQVFIDVLDAVGDPYVRTVAFADDKQAMAYSSTGNRGEGFPVSYFRCGFDRAKLDPALSQQASTLGRDVRDRLTGPDTELLNRQEVVDLARTMGLEK